MLEDEDMGAVQSTVVVDLEPAKAAAMILVALTLGCSLSAGTVIYGTVRDQLSERSCKTIWVPLFPFSCTIPVDG